MSDLDWLQTPPPDAKKHFAVVHWLEARDRKLDAAWCRAAFEGQPLNIHGFRLIQQAYADYEAAHPGEGGGDAD